MKNQITKLRAFIVASLLFTAATSKAQTWNTTGNAGTDTATNFIGTTDAKGIKFKANNQTRMYIDKGGKVGIGTTDPQTLLDVYAETASCALGLRSNAGSSFFFMDKKNPTDNSTVSYRTNGSAVWQTGTFGNNDFAIKNIGFGNSITCLQSNNYVGIGTTAPTALLDVNADAKINSLTIGRGLGNVSTNSAFGFEALLSNWSFNNTAVGYSVLRANTSGSTNTGLGTSALQTNSTGSGNSAFGNESMLNNQNGNFNVALGARTLYTNSTGSENVASGIWSMYNNTSGSNNSAYGAWSMQANTTGSGNTALGNYALRSNTAGYSNVAVGNSALYSNTALTHIVAIGDSALYNLNGGNGYNTAVGSKSMFSTTTGAYNVALGNYSLFFNTTGHSNTAIGVSALFKNITGIRNTASGLYAMSENTTGSNNTVTGSYALSENTTGSNNTAYGYNTMPLNVSGSSNIAIGFNTMFANSTGSNNIGIGNYALNSNTEKNNLIAIGDSALYNNGTGATLLNQAINNTAIGIATLKSNTTGSNNTAVGKWALNGNTAGSYNSAFGENALLKNTTGIQNSAFGYQALYNNTTGYSNVGIGLYSLINNNSGFWNCAIGVAALEINTSGKYNTAVGGYALNRNDTGSFNVALGYYSGYGDNIGSYGFTKSTFLGSYSYATMNRTNITMIGFGVANAQITGNNQIALGNTSISQIRAQVSGITAYSDGRYKTNVKNDVKGLDFINLLKPVSYNVKPTELHKIWGTPDSLVKLIDHSETEKVRYTGFIAQDVEKAMRESGYEFTGIDIPKNEKENYALRYTEFIMPLVKAVQELDSKNNALVEENEQLKKDIADIKAALNIKASESKNSDSQMSGSKISVSPNPFNANTTVSFDLNKSVTAAMIKILSADGRVVKTINVNDRGKVNVEIPANDLSAGNYFVQVIVDGNILDIQKVSCVK